MNITGIGGYISMKLNRKKYKSITSGSNNGLSGLQRDIILFDCDNSYPAIICNP